MMTFDWSRASSTLKDFGGKPVTLYVPKTGLPFFDVLRLYGAIDLYIGLREDVEICDKGNEWKLEGRQRAHMKGRDEDNYKQIKGERKAKEYCHKLRSCIFEKQTICAEDEFFVKAERDFVGLDAVLQTGIRGVAAYCYETLQTGQTSKSECKAEIPLSQGMLAYVGKKRTENLGNIMFLPVFEGRIDFSKVVAPLHYWIGQPNVICAQVLMLLGMKTSLFAEGYQDRLSAVVYNTDYDSRKYFNCSGIISLQSTALEKGNLSAEVTDQVYRVFKRIIERAWRKDRNPKDPSPEDALAMAYWLMQPVGKHLSSMITSQERLLKVRGYYQQIFIKPEYVKEVFGMSYGDWKGDHEAVRKFARTVASAIYSARQCKEVDKSKKGKAWYDEVVMLRSAPTAKAFIERALILVEQGHKEYSLIGTAHKDEAYDPSKLFDSIGKDRSTFETFRDLFRMYLIQESTYKQEESGPEVSVADTSETNKSGEEEQQ
ncbi:MAG: hypothetical protein IT451_06700 [Candidatus Brocadia sp.]|nr:hypothetical protein [Candidatus Brocadia sp.]